MNMKKGSNIVLQEELSRHCHANDCWIAVHGNVYNVTAFLQEHPGGAQLILEHAGKDASAGFAAVHAAAFLDMLPASAHVGVLEAGGGGGVGDEGGEDEGVPTNKLASGLFYPSEGPQVKRFWFFRK
jgi:cytochrome b involved in lipid metabolism